MNQVKSTENLLLMFTSPSKSIMCLFTTKCIQIFSIALTSESAIISNSIVHVAMRDLITLFRIKLCVVVVEGNENYCVDFFKPNPGNVCRVSDSQREHIFKETPQNIFGLSRAEISRTRAKNSDISVPQTCGGSWLMNCFVVNFLTILMSNKNQKNIKLFMS